MTWSPTLTYVVSVAAGVIIETPPGGRRGSIAVVLVKAVLLLAPEPVALADEDPPLPVMVEPLDAVLEPELDLLLLFDCDDCV